MGCGGSASSQPASASRTTAGTNVRLPATFKILRADRLSPPGVYAPAHIPIELILISRDGRSHRAALRTPRPRTLVVPANGRAERLVPGLGKGNYPLEVDGRTRGALHVGFGPGP